MVNPRDVAEEQARNAARDVPDSAESKSSDDALGEHVLQESKLKSLLLDNAGDSIFVFDVNGRIVFANEAAYETRGYTKAELYRMNLRDLVAPEFKENVEKHNQRIFQFRKSKFESAHVRKDGTVMPVEVNALTYRIEGKPLFASIVRDITERKAAEAALRESFETLERRVEERTAELRRANDLLKAEIEVRKRAELALKKAFLKVDDERAKAEAIIEAISDPISIQDVDFKILYANKAHKRVMGDHVGEYCYKAYHGYDEVCKDCVLKLAFADGRVHTVEKDSALDRSRSVEITASPIRDASGNIVGAVEMVRDITDVKRVHRYLKEKYEVEHHIAEVLQERLIRPVPDLPGLDIGVQYQPARARERVGGDFYDIFTIDGSNIAVLVGDVSGKGVEAAGLTETIRSTVRALAYIDPSPSIIFDRTNKSMIDQMSPTKFATAALLIINPKLGLIRYANAGHPPLVLHSSNGSRLVEAPRGLPLGSFLGGFQEHFFSLKDGESVILYTDGLIEMRKGKTLFGEEGLLGALDQITGLGSQRVADHLLRSAEAFAEGKLRDDVVIVVVRAEETALSPEWREPAGLDRLRLDIDEEYAAGMMTLEMMPDFGSTVLDTETLRKLGKLFDAIPSCVMLVDEDHHIVLANNEVTKMFSVGPETVVGHYCPRVIHGINGPFEGCPLEEAVEKGTSIEREFYDEDKRRWVVSAVYPTRFTVSNGKQVFLHMTRDITERKAVEEVLSERDKAIRQAYVDVLSAVTGGKLLLMTKEELLAGLGERILEPTTIGSYQDLAKARQRIRDAVRTVFPEIDEAKEFMVAVGEGLTNAVKHAGDGRYSVYVANGRIQVAIFDDGCGIDFATLPKATLTAGFSTAQSLGMGFNIMLELSDRLILATEPGSTAIVLELDPY